MPPPQFTIRRLMLEVIFMAVLLAPIGWAGRQPAGEIAHTVAWVMAAGWVGTLLLIRWAYRDFRNPFG